MHIMVNMHMKDNLTYWKSIACNLLLALQSLYLAVLIRGFFTIVTIETSPAAYLFIGLPSSLTMIIMAVWAQAIFVITICLLIKIVFTHTPLRNAVDILLIYEIVISCIMFAGVLILAVMAPTILWPVVYSYSTNVAWALAIIYYSLIIKRDLMVDRRYGSNPITPDRRNRRTYINDILPHS